MAEIRPKQQGSSHKMKADVDEDMCIGSGKCEATCPDVFEVTNGKSHVKTNPVPEDQEECVREAIEGCPVSAISQS